MGLKKRSYDIEEDPTQPLFRVASFDPTNEFPYVPKPSEAANELLRIYNMPQTYHTTYNRKRVIEHGSFGVVVEYEEKESGTKLAIKEALLPRRTLVEASRLFCHELAKRSSSSTTPIIYFADERFIAPYVVVTPGKSIAMPLATCTLFEFYSTHTPYVMSESQVARVTTCLLQTLEDLRVKYGLWYVDVKAENVLVYVERSNDVFIQLGDHGSVVSSNQSSLSTIAGTPLNGVNCIFSIPVLELQSNLTVEFLNKEGGMRGSRVQVYMVTCISMLLLSKTRGMCVYGSLESYATCVNPSSSGQDQRVKYDKSDLGKFLFVPAVPRVAAISLYGARQAFHMTREQQLDAFFKFVHFFSYGCYVILSDTSWGAVTTEGEPRRFFSRLYACVVSRYMNKSIEKWKQARRKRHRSAVVCVARLPSIESCVPTVTKVCKWYQRHCRHK